MPTDITPSSTPNANPGTPPEPVTQPDAQPNATNFIDDMAMYAKDAITGVVAGAEQGAGEIRQTARSIEQVLPESMQDAGVDEPLETKAAQPETNVGFITGAITQAALGFGIGSIALRGVAFKGTSVLGNMTKEAIGSGLTANPDQERLSSLFMQFPWLEPIMAPIAQDPSDPRLVGKAKAILENVLTTGGAQATFNGLRLLYLKAMAATPGTGMPIHAALIPKVEAEVIADAAKASPGATDLVLDPKLKSSVLTSKTQVEEYKQVKLSDLTVREQDHLNTAGRNPVEPAKVEAIQASMQAGKTQTMPPVDVTTDPLTGELRLLDGRHRAIAAELQGYQTITAKVLRDKNAKELVAELPQPTKAPVTVTTADGSSGVQLTPATQAKFEAISSKLVIQDAAEGVPNPTAEMVKSAAKEGAPLRPKYNDSPNNVLQTLAELGKLTKTQMAGITPATRSLKETHRLAEIMGQDHESLLANLKSLNMGLEDADAVAMGARQYLQTKGSEMWSAARAATISGDPAAKELFKAQYMHLAEFQAELSEVTTRLGRGLRSFGESAGPFKADKIKSMLADAGESDKLARIIMATDGDVDKVAHVLKMQQLSFFQKAVGVHNEYWTGLGLLSRVATQTVNLSSTALNSIMEPASMIVGGVEQGLTGHGWAAAREGVGIYAGMRTSFFDSLHMAWQAAKTEHAVISQAGTMEQPTKFISALTYNMNPDNFGGKFIDLMGNITRMSFRGLTAGDEFFKQLSYRAKVSATAGREATDMVKAGTLQKTEVESYIAKQLQASIDELGSATNPDALKYAEKASFVNDLKGATWGDYTSLGAAMARVASSIPPVRGVILPFVKTPTNVTRTTFEYTPLVGQLRAQFRDDVLAGGEKQAMAIGKLTIGAGMYAAAGMLALEGRITGAPPAPGVIVPKGWKPYSVVFRGMGEDGGDLYISYQRMQPFGDVLGLTADFAKSSGMIDEDTRDGVAHSMSLALSKMIDGGWGAVTQGTNAAASAYGKSLISKTYFRSMTEFFSTFSGYNNENQMARWFQNYSASHVPGVLAQFNSDDTVREVRSTLDAIMARVPGLSQMLPARRDYFGQVHDVKVGYPFSIVQPLAVSETKPDPVMNELHRLSTSKASVKFGDMEHRYVIGGQKVDLKTVTNSDGVTAYDRMQELMQTVKPRGESKNFHDKLSVIMNGPRYHMGQESEVLDGNPITPGVRTVLVKKAEGEYREAALDKMKSEFATELGIKSPLQDKIDLKTGRAKVRAGIFDKILEIGK